LLWLTETAGRCSWSSPETEPLLDSVNVTGSRPGHDMIEYIKAVILGILEGLTEFLPISSTGHLIVARRLLNFVDTGGTFELVIQLGAILAVIWYFRQDIWSRLRRLHSDRGLAWVLAIAFLPAAVVGLLMGSKIKDLLFNPLTVAISLIAGGVILWVVDSERESATDSTLDNVTRRQALLVGIGQLAAFVPGVSRSGATIVGGIATGMDRKTATEFSFYLAIPTLGIATVYDFVQNYQTIVESGQMGLFAAGTVSAFLVALFAIGWLLRYISRHSFRNFAIYRILVGLFILGLLATSVL